MGFTFRHIRIKREEGCSNTDTLLCFQDDPSAVAWHDTPILSPSAHPWQAGTNNKKTP